MSKSTTAERLKLIMNERNLKQVDILRACQPYCERLGIKLGKNDLSQYISDKSKPGQEKLSVLGLALGVDEAWLAGYDVPRRMNENNSNFLSPNITADTVTFPVLGEVAAGYDKIAVEDWAGETIEVPATYLKGRDKSEFFVLSVKGNSMYPQFQNGDKVLVLKQSTLNHSGDVGVVMYDGECATLKRVEFIKGEDWMKLLPINPEYMPKLIEGSDLESCRILGIPSLLIRKFE